MDVEINRLLDILVFSYIFFTWFYKIMNYILVILVLGNIFFILFKNNAHSTALLKRTMTVYENIVAGFLTKGDVREENFRDAIKAFQNFPIKGVGLGNMWKNYSKWEVHNSFLSIMS